MQMRVALLAMYAGGLLLAGAGPLAAAEGQTKSSTAIPKESAKTAKSSSGKSGTGNSGTGKQATSTFTPLSLVPGFLGSGDKSKGAK